MSTDTADLILHAIETLRSDLQTLREEVRAGFDKVNGRLGKLEGRVNQVERWQAEHDSPLLWGWPVSRPQQQHRQHRNPPLCAAGHHLCDRCQWQQQPQGNPGEQHSR